jgi:LacI family transcriptional regulator
VPAINNIATDPKMPKRTDSPDGERRPTMTDVAKAAGVSQSTVSMVLNSVDGARLAATTRARVLSVAMELGYRLTRRDPVLQRTQDAGRMGRPLVAYLIDELSTSVHPVQSVDGARDAAWQHDCVLSVAVTRGNLAQEAAVIESFKSHPQLLGFIYSTIFTREVQLPDSLVGVPTVLLNCHCAGFTGPVVVPSELAGGHSATEYLLGKGHTRIGYVNGEPWMEAAKDRLKGYRRALATHDIAFDATLVRDGDWNMSSGYAAARELMRLERPPTAIFCANDLMAMGALDALHELGLKVPEQVAVMGYDDQEMAQHTRPALSTALLPNYEMGRSALEALLETAQADPGAKTSSRPRIMKIECPVVSRDSA